MIRTLTRACRKPDQSDTDVLLLSGQSAPCLAFGVNTVTGHIVQTQNNVLDGTMIGSPFAGDRMLLVDIIAHALPAGLPASAVREQPSGPIEVGVICRTNQRVQLDSFTSISTGSNAWIPRRCRVGARLAVPGVRG